MHITVISRLYGQEASSYVSILRGLSRARRFAMPIYDPVRHAIVNEIRDPGSGKQDLHRRMASLNRYPNASAFKAANEQAFDVFLSTFAPDFTELVADFVRPMALAPVTLEGYPIEGRFHFSAKDRRGATRYVYIQAAEADPAALQALSELLGVIAEQRHDSPRDTAWLMDLRGAQMIQPPKRNDRVRKRIVGVMEIASMLMERYADAA
jgi:hypothetical protein